jgi:hypothetical protein
MSAIDKESMVHEVLLAAEVAVASDVVVAIDVPKDQDRTIDPKLIKLCRNSAIGADIFYVFRKKPWSTNIGGFTKKAIALFLLGFAIFLPIAIHISIFFVLLIPVVPFIALIVLVLRGLVFNDRDLDFNDGIRAGLLVVTRQGLCDVDQHQDKNGIRPDYKVAKVFTWSEVERIAVDNEYIIVIGRSNFAISDDGGRVDTTPTLVLRFQDEHGSALEVAQKIRSIKDGWFPAATSFA